MSQEKPINDREIVERWLVFLRDRKRLAPSTLYQYQQKVENFLGFIAPATLQSVDEALVERWLQRPAPNGRRVAAATQARDLTILRGLWDLALRKGWLVSSPLGDLVAPKVANRHPRPIPDDVWVSWYGAKHGDSDALGFIGCGYLLGLRRAEILRLHSDLITPRSLQIQGLVRKGGGDDTLDPVSLVKIVAQRLPHLLPDKGERWLDWFARRVRAGGLLFDWRDVSYQEQRKYALPSDENDPQWCYRRIDRWARAQKLVPFRPHDLRHGFATNLIRCDLPIALVSRLCNHADIQTTMRYVKVGSADLRGYLKEEQRWELPSRM